MQRRRSDSQEEDHPSVGHGVGQSQDAAAHDGVAQVEDRHPERGLALKLEGVKPSQSSGRQQWAEPH